MLTKILSRRFCTDLSRLKPIKNVPSVNKSNRKILSFFGASSVLAAVGTVVGAKYAEMPIDIFLYQAYRLGLASYHIGMISLDYKWTFRGVLPGTPEHKALRPDIDKRTAARLLHLCKTQGGVYVKVGQHIASMNQFLPAEVTEILSQLQDKAAYHPFSHVEKVFLEDLGKKPDQIFQSFDRIPVASASLAQVHKAVLPDGTKCAVKVQYPNMDAMFRGDIAAISLLLKATEAIFPYFRLSWVLPQFQHIKNELEFQREANNSRRAKMNFQGNSKVHIPNISSELSTSRILTMEFIDGIKVDNLEALKNENIDTLELAKLIHDVFNTQVFEHGFVHADPHPGNLLVRKVENETQLVILDHGLYREIPEKIRLDYCKLWRALVLGNVKDIEKYARALGAGDMHQLFAMILTFRPPGSKDVGSQKKLSPEERQRMREIFGGSFQVGMERLTGLLSTIPSELLFVFKTGNLVRALTMTLGATTTTNRLVNMARHALNGIQAQYPSGTLWSIRKYFEKIHFEFALLLISTAVYFAEWMGLLGISNQNTVQDTNTSVHGQTTHQEQKTTNSSGSPVPKEAVRSIVQNP